MEDEPRIRRLFREELHEAGFRTLEARNGQDPVELLDSVDSIALVLLDVTRSNSRGQRLLDLIRERRPRIKILVSSIYRREEGVSTIRNADGYYCTSDPLETLSRQIRSLLQPASAVHGNGKNHENPL